MTIFADTLSLPLYFCFFLLFACIHGQELQSRVCSGRQHACALSTNGQVRCWGGNSFGQLGYGDVLQRGDGANEMGENLPYVDLGNDVTAVALACGYDHTCVRLSGVENQIKCWGKNDHGQLGYGDILNRGDQPGEMGDNLPTVVVGQNRFVNQVVAGEDFTCVRTDINNIKCWGKNDLGQLGIGTNITLLEPQATGVELDATNAVAQISAGRTHVCVRLNSGRAKCWGENNFGQLGYGDTLNRGDGPNEMGTNLGLISLGANHQVTQIQAGDAVSCARLADNDVKCWGTNSFGQLGYAEDAQNPRIGDEANEMGSNLAAVDFGTGAANVQWVGLGIELTCVYFVDGRLKCYGAYGGVASDANNYIDLGSNTAVESLRLGFETPCVVLLEGVTSGAGVKCFGSNSHGQLGQGNTVDRFNFQSLGDALNFIDLTSPLQPTNLPTSSPTLGPTPSPLTPAPTPTTPTAATGAPTPATGAPTSATDAPTSATDAPTSATGAPTSATDAPTPATPAPTLELTGSPTAAAVETSSTDILVLILGVSAFVVAFFSLVGYFCYCRGSEAVASV